MSERRATPAGQISTEARLAELILSVSRRLVVLTHDQPPGTGLSPLEAMVMRQIDAHPGISPSRLAAVVGLKSSNASAALRQLEAKGFLRRCVDPEDGRAITIRPTQLAQDGLAVKREVWGRALEPYVGDRGALADTVAMLARMDEMLEADAIRANSRHKEAGAAE